MTYLEHMLQTCKYCGAWFIAAKYGTKNNRRVYCSRTCLTAPFHTRRMCNGICKVLCIKESHLIVRPGARTYKSGNVHCMKCERWFQSKPHMNRCPCCNQQLRVAPRKKHLTVGL